MVTRRKKARQKQKKRGHLGKVPPILRNLPKGAKLIGAIPGMPKMSAVFLDFLEPYWKNEAQLRKLADYAFILQDYRFAMGIYDTVKKDFANDKATKHLAGAHVLLLPTFFFFFFWHSWCVLSFIGNASDLSGDPE